MRRQVAEISEHDTAATLEIPATRDEIAALATTLNGLLMRLQAALTRERGFVAEAGKETDRLIRLAEGMLLLARVGGGSAVLRPAALSVSDLLAPSVHRADLLNGVGTVGAITVSVRLDVRGDLVVVADRDRFRRADTARTRDRGGAGLGLPIVRSLMTAHGGTATALNHPDGGAVIRLVLPVVACHQVVV